MADKPLMSFAQLSSAADSLNQASDELSETINSLDSAILRLNIGLTEWVQVVLFQDPGDPTYELVQLGWTKNGGHWGINIRKLVGDERDAEDGEVRDIWAFNDAPRDLRLQAVEKLPELLDRLGKSEKRTAESVNKKAAETRALIAAMGIPGVSQ